MAVATSVIQVMATATQPAIVTLHMWEWVCTSAVVMVTHRAMAEYTVMVEATVEATVAFIAGTAAVMAGMAEVMAGMAEVMVEATAVVITKGDAIRYRMIKSGRSDPSAPFFVRRYNGC